MTGDLKKLFVLICAGLLLTACSGWGPVLGADDEDVAEAESGDTEGGSDDDEAPATDDGEDATAQEETGAEAEDTEAQSGEPAQVQDGSPERNMDDAIASIRYDVENDDAVTASVITLEEVDGIMLMEVLYWPHPANSSTPTTVYDLLGHDDLANRRYGALPRIYDRENLKIYRPFHHNNTLKAVGTPSAIEGEAIYWWGYYPELEDDVATVDIEFARSYPHLEGVPTP